MTSIIESSTLILKFIDLIRLEQKIEVEEIELLLKTYSASTLQKIGLALINLSITTTKTGLGGKNIVSFEANTLSDQSMNTCFRIGDVVSINNQFTKKEQKSVTGVVFKVHEKRIVIATNEQLEEEGNVWKLIKLSNEVTFKRMVSCLESLLKLDRTEHSSLIKVLFGESPTQTKRDCIKPESRLNESQLEAIQFCLESNEVALIHGPPGTGKTHTLIELMVQLVKLNKRILVTAPSNIAVDNILERLLKHKNIKPVRIGNMARVLPKLTDYSIDHLIRNSDMGQIVRELRSEIDQKLKIAKNTRSRNEKRNLFKEISEMRKDLKNRDKNVIEHVLRNCNVVLSTLNGVGSKLFAHQFFDVLIIDEATQALEAESWIPMLKCTKAILAGDHHQLPPTVKSKNAALEKSMFERLLDLHKKSICRMLNTQYRMNDKIMQFSSNQLYGNNLVSHESVSNHTLEDILDPSDCEVTRIPIIYVDTNGYSLTESSSVDPKQKLSKLFDDSKYNNGEVSIVLKHCQLLIDAGVRDEDIGIISPYNAQVSCISNELKEKFPRIEIHSVDGFQGREKEAIILSLVRSNEKREVGFLKDYRRLNVAITRPKRHLCIIGDSGTLFASYTHKENNVKENEKSEFLYKLGKYVENNAETWYPDMYD